MRKRGRRQIFVVIWVFFLYRFFFRIDIIIAYTNTILVYSSLSPRIKTFSYDVSFDTNVIVIRVWISKIKKRADIDGKHSIVAVPLSR